MINLAHGKNAIPVGRKVFGHRDRSAKNRVIAVVIEPVQTGSLGVKSGEHAGTRRSANRVVAVRGGEADAAPRQPIKVWCRNMRLPVRMKWHVVEVIDDHEENVGTLLTLRTRTSEHQQNEGKLTFHEKTLFGR